MTSAEALVPYLSVHDAAGALAFYARAFGAVERMRMTGDDGRIGHCEFTIGTVRVMMADEHPDIGFVGPRALGGSPVLLHLEVADVDASHDRAVAAGAESTHPPSDQAYGDRNATIVDPYGHRWTLSQRVEEVTLDELAAREPGYTVTAVAPPVMVWPSLNYTDAPAAIRSLVDVFGFTERLVVPGDDGVVEHAQLRWPEGGGIMLGSAHREGNPFSQRPTGAGSTYVVTDHPDALYERARDAGLAVGRELRDEDYGSRGFSVRDAEGNIWSFGTYRGE
jgi:uncharacterized glyoxalase superfamily protein PhnB